MQTHTLQLTEEQITDLKSALRAGARYAIGHSEQAKKEGKFWDAASAQAEADRILRALDFVPDISL